jgi:hypothetical protein
MEKKRGKRVIVKKGRKRKQIIKDHQKKEGS